MVFRSRYLQADSNGDPILLPPTSPGVTSINLGTSDFFWVELVVQDVRGNTPQDSGVDSAYIDMLISSFPNNPQIPVLVEPVLDVTGTNFVIQFDDPPYGLNKRDDATFSVPDTVQEIGAARHPAPPTGNGQVDGDAGQVPRATTVAR